MSHSPQGRSILFLEELLDSLVKVLSATGALCAAVLSIASAAPWPCQGAQSCRYLPRSCAHCAAGACCTKNVWASGGEHVGLNCVIQWV